MGLYLQEVLLQAIKKGTGVRFEADGNKVIYVSPTSAYGLNKDIVEVYGSGEIVYLEGEYPSRFISKREVAAIRLLVDENFNVAKIDEEAPQRVEENLLVPKQFFGKEIGKFPFRRELSKEELETPPFLKNKIL